MNTVPVFPDQLELALQPGLFLFLPESFLDVSPSVCGVGEQEGSEAGCSFRAELDSSPAPHFGLGSEHRWPDASGWFEDCPPVSGAFCGGGA